MFEIIKTEAFWAPALGIAVLLLLGALILIDRYRRPEIYSKKSRTKIETTERRES